MLGGQALKFAFEVRGAPQETPQATRLLDVRLHVRAEGLEVRKCCVALVAH